MVPQERLHDASSQFQLLCVDDCILKANLATRLIMILTKILFYKYIYKFRLPTQSVLSRA